MPDDPTADLPTAAEAPHAPPSPLTDAPAAVGTVLDGRWSVAEVRRGGQAWVLIADDLDQGVRRALKVPPADALTGDAELAMLLGLDPHPHVVTTLDEIGVGGARGLVLEYAPGTLADVLRQRRGASAPPPVPDPLAEILQGVCDGMAHLSAATEVAHLDLKPSNILIGPTGRAKVADFGLAQPVRIRDGRFPSARGGTWAYAAPEVLRDEPCDTRADVFSFGVLLYETYTGRLPYPFALDPDPAAQRAQLVAYYTTEGPKRLTEGLYYDHNPVAPLTEPIGMVLSSCLMRHMDDRTPSFRALSTMLSRGLRRAPVRETAAALPEHDQWHRELTLSHVLIRLGRHDEAVNRLNRLLAAPALPGELHNAVRRAAHDALTGSGRHAQAAALREGW